MVNKKKLIKSGIELIPLSEIEIKEDKNKTVGYDFTVEDFFTFFTKDNIAVMDCMAIYFPVTDISIQEVSDKVGIWNNLISPTDINIVPSPNQDIILGIYHATKEDSKKTKELKETKLSIGRYLFNLCLPENYPIINEPITKSKLKVILNDIALRYNSEIVMTVLDRIKELGFNLSTLQGYSLGINDLYDPELEKFPDTLSGDSSKDMEKIKNDKNINEILKSKPYSTYIESGARGTWDQAKQLVLTRGYVAGADNKIKDNLIKHSLVVGLTPREFFDSSWGSRKGLLDTALSTGDSGYLTRQLIYSTVSIELDKNNPDCGTTDTLPMFIKNKKMAKCILWRNYIDESGEIKNISLKNYESFIGKTINLRSPIYCKGNKICKTCYGNLYQILHGSNQIGIIATQAVGERTTQLVLRTFHTSGSASGSKDGKNDDIISGMTIANKLFHNPESLNENSDVMRPEDFIEKIYSVFGEYGAIHLIHYEIIASAMMWSHNKFWRLEEDRNNTEYKWTSILKVPAKTSWLLGCAFSNLKSKLIDGLVYGLEDVETSITKLFRL